MAVAALGRPGDSFQQQGGLHQPLMDEFKVEVAGGDGKHSAVYDDLEPPPAAPVKTACSRWRGRMIALCGIGAFVALRAANLALWTNAIGSFGAGLAIQALIEAGHKGATSARIRQVCLPIFGQVSLFALSQGFQNTTNSLAQVCLTHAIIALLGANTEITARWHIKKGGVRTESVAPATATGAKLPRVQYMNHNITHALKIVAAVACGAGYFFVADTLLKGYLSFGASMFASQVLGERVIDALDKKIEKDGRYRIPKAILLTLCAAQPLAFVPWASPTTEERIKQLVYVGIGLGFINGATVQSQMRRIEHIPIDQLEEFQKLKSPEKPKKYECARSTLNYLAYKVFQFAVPVVSLAGLLGFTLWQEISELSGTDQRVALGSMLAGFILTYLLFKKIDQDWDPKTRNKLKDNMMVSFWASPRILGIPPLLLYYAGTNSLKMDGTAVGASQSPYHLAALILSWIAYGGLMGRELQATESERPGNPELKDPKLLNINAAITMYLSIKGINP